MNEIVAIKKKVIDLADKLSLDVVKGDKFSDVYSEVVDMIGILTDAKKSADDKMKTLMREEYLKTGTQTIKNKGMTITYVPGGVRDTFDSAKFKADNPELYAKYVKTSATAEALRVKINEVKEK